MKKYIYRPLLLALGALFLYSNSFGQAVPCPSVTPTGTPSVTGTPGVTLTCDSPCATLWATVNATLNATTSYTVTPVTYLPFSYTTGTIPTYGSAGTTLLTTMDDNYGNLVPLPFSFCYFGNTYNQVVIGTNGNITFDVTMANAGDPWSMSGGLPGAAAAATRNAILSPWNDLYPPGGGSIRYASYGTAPCRVFVVSWNAVDLYSGSCTDVTTSQIVLYESSNIIDINIAHRAPCSAWNSGLAITGIQNAAGTTFYTAPGENGTTFTANNEAWRFTPNGTVSTWNYTWSGPSGVIGTGTSVSVCPAMSTVYTVTASASACSAVTISSTIPVTVTTLTAISGPLTVCAGLTAALTDATPGGTWMSTAPAVATIGSTSGIVTGVSPGTASITYTTPSGCHGTAIFTVTALPVTGIPDMCQNFTTTLTAAVPGGTWTSGNAAVATVNAASGVVMGVTGGTAIITYTSTTGCQMTKIVTVHPKPAIPTQLPPTSYCQFSIPVPVAATGTSLTWYGPGVTAGYTVSPTPSTATPGTSSYFITQTSAFGCKSDSGTAAITIIEKPAAPIVSDTMYCQDFGNPAPLSANGSNIHWYNQSGTLISGTPTPSTAMIGTTTYYADQTVNGCTSDKAPLVVTVIFKPDFNIRYSNNKVCQFDTLRLSYDGPVMVGPSYHWDLPYGTTIISGTIYDTAITVRFDTASGTHVVYLTASDLNGMCSTVKSLSIKVIPQPGAHGSIRPDICLGDTILLALTNHSDNASLFTWSVDGKPLTSSPDVNIITASSNSGGPFSVSFNTWGRHIIVVQGTADGMCASIPTSDSVNVHDLPDATFKVKNIQSKFCIEDSVEFVATATGANYSYAWAPSHSFSDVNKYDVWGKAEQERSIISLTVIDPFGCKSTYSMELDPETCCKVLMPSGFSPNGDAKNDTYKPMFNGFHRFHMFRITNRWGQTVYECTNSDPHWDGTYNGVPQDIGVYFFYIKYDCGGKTIEEKGDVTLVR
jgi:gliding motility-associated-like protein